MIYAFTGKKQSGKSTASKYLAEKLGATRINFKDALVAEIKERLPNLIQAICEIMERTEYDGNRPWTYERLVQDKPKLMRTLLQNYGTEVRRRDHEDYWVVQWLRQATKVKGDIVVDDIRFSNEAKAVTDLGGIVIRIEREGLVSSDTHASELEMNKILVDYTISVGTGDFAELYTQLDRITVKE